MLPRINPTTTRAWPLLQQHYSEMKSVHLREFFRKDPQRFSKYSLQQGDILFDYSKNIITDKTLALLFQLADECKVKDAITAMFNGDIINETEHRSVLHTALRNFSDQPVFSEGNDVMPEVKKALKKMKAFCNAIHSGKLRGYSGKKHYASSSEMEL